MRQNISPRRQDFDGLSLALLAMLIALLTCWILAHIIPAAYGPRSAQRAPVTESTIDGRSTST